MTTRRRAARVTTSLSSTRLVRTGLGSEHHLARSLARRWRVRCLERRADILGPMDCTQYGGPYCIYPWVSWDGADTG